MTCCLNLNFSIPYSLSLDVQSSQQVQFRLSENFCFSLELVFLLSELSLSVIKKKKKCQTVIFKRMIHTNFRASRASEHLSSQTTGPKKKKKDQNCVCYLCGFRLVWQPVHDKTSASSFYKYSFARKHRNSGKKYPEIFLVAFWLALTSLADRITVYFSAVDAAVFSRVRVTKSRCYHIYAVSFFWV